MPTLAEQVAALRARGVPNTEILAQLRGQTTPAYTDRLRSLLNPETYGDKTFQRGVATELEINQPKAAAAAETKRAEKRAGVAPTEDLLNQIARSSNKINTIDEGPRARLVGSWRLLKARAGADTDVEEYEALTGRIANLARGLGGEKGVLTDRDIARIMKAIPNPTDKKETARRKIASLRRSLVAAQAAFNAVGADASAADSAAISETFGF